MGVRPPIGVLVFAKGPTMVFVAVSGVPLLVVCSPPLDLDLPGNRDSSFGTAVNPNPKVGTGSLLMCGRTYMPSGPVRAPNGITPLDPNLNPIFLSPLIAGRTGWIAK